jgi:ankyrin repeat protein
VVSAVPLCFAAAGLSKVDMLRILINELGANANQSIAGSNDPMQDGCFPLYMAAQHGHVAALRCLVKEFGAHVNRANNEGSTPLLIAAHNGHLAAVQCLVKELGADANRADPAGWTPLHIAAERGQLSVVQCLVKELGADPNQANNDGCTPLFIAAQRGHMSVVQCLIKEFGADINQATFNGSTPLMVAAAHKHTDIVVWLSKHGADAQALHQHGGTAADVSREYDAPAELTEYLHARAHCANPGCDGAGLKKCAGCLKVFFCSPTCIRAHWPAHKAECKRIAEAAKVKSGKGK